MSNLSCNTTEGPLGPVTLQGFFLRLEAFLESDVIGRFTALAVTVYFRMKGSRFGMLFWLGMHVGMRQTELGVYPSLVEHRL